MVLATSWLRDDQLSAREDCDTGRYHEPRHFEKHCQGGLAMASALPPTLH